MNVSFESVYKIYKFEKFNYIFEMVLHGIRL